MSAKPHSAGVSNCRTSGDLCDAFVRNRGLAFFHVEIDNAQVQEASEALGLHRHTPAALAADKFAVPELKPTSFTVVARNADRSASLRYRSESAPRHHGML
jgi:hypothetical protein